MCATWRLTHDTIRRRKIIKLRNKLANVNTAAACWLLVLADYAIPFHQFQECICCCVQHSLLGMRFVVIRHLEIESLFCLEKRIRQRNHIDLFKLRIITEFRVNVKENGHVDLQNMNDNNMLINYRRIWRVHQFTYQQRVYTLMGSYGQLGESRAGH